MELFGGNKEKLQQGVSGPYDEMKTLLRKTIAIWS